MPDDFETRMGVKHAAQHEANALRRGLDGKAPAGAQDPRMFFDVVVVVSLDHRRMRDSRVHVERYVKHLSPLKDRPKPLVVEKNPLVSPFTIAPLKPSLPTVRSSSSAAALGLAVGSAAKAANLSGWARTASLRRSLARRANGTAVSASSFWSPGIVCDNTCRSMPASSISFKRSSSRSWRRCTVAGAAIAVQTAGVPLHFGIVVMLLQSDAVGFGSHSASS